jgi:hypothetical protein
MQISQRVDGNLLTRQARRRTAGGRNRARQCSFGQLSSTSPNAAPSMWRSSLRTLQWAVSFGDNPVVALDAGRLKLLRKALIVRKAMSASACFTAAATGSMTGTRI